MLRPDTLIHERYRVIRLIGQGGFGAVYEAVDERLNRRVALKQLVRVNERINRQFTREAQLLANLHHPALPRVTDHFTEDNSPFLVMDYIAGDDLATVLYDRNAPFGLDEALDIGDQLLDVLHYLHTLQPPIIHRDIKPQNLKLRGTGGVILLDFGLAKGHAGEVLPSSGASSMTAFTRGFAPPEQIEGSGTDARSDLYALGATLYCLLTNAAPPEAQTRLITVMRGRRDPLPLAHELSPAVPEAVSRVLHQAMALEMADRPADALAMRSMLEAARDGTRPSPLVDRTRPGISMPTEIDPPNDGPANSPVEALYQEALALLAAQRWHEARQRFEAVDRSVPGYRDTRARLVELRQHVESVVPADRFVDHDDRRSAQPVSMPTGPRGGRPWLVLGGALLMLAVIAVLSLQVAGVIQLIPSQAVVVSPTAVVVAEGSLEAAPSASARPSPAAPSPTDAPAAPSPEPTSAPTARPSAAATPTAAPSSNEQEVARRLDNAYVAFQRRGGLDEAIAEAQAAADLDPGNAEPHALLSLLYMQRFDWNAVATEAQAALERDPRHAAAYSFLSQAHREQDDLKQALADADKSIELDGELSLGYTARAFVQLRLADRSYDRGKVDAALADTEKAVELSHDEDAYHRVEAYAAKASVLASRHQYTQDPRDLQLAIEEYRQAIGSQVEIAWHHSNLGSLLSNARRYDDAAKAFDAALQRDPNFYGAYEGRGWMLYAQAQYDAAIEAFTTSIKLNPLKSNVGSYLGRAYAHHSRAYEKGADKTAELNAARDDMLRATELKPDSAWYQYNLASMLQDAEDPTANEVLRKAIGMFKWDLQRNQQNASAHEGLGWTYWRLSEFDQSLKAFDSAIAANAKHVGGYQGKAYTLSSLTQPDAACAALQAGIAELPGNAVLKSTQEQLNCQ